MSNFKVSWDNLIDYPGVLITASGYATTMVPANVANSLPSKIWRAPIGVDGAAWIGFDLLTPQAFKVVSCHFRRTVTPEKSDKTVFFAPTDKIRVRCSNVALGDGELYDSGSIDSGVIKRCGTFALWLQNAVTARYIRIDLVATSQVSDACVDLKRVWIGPTLEPKRGFDWGINHAWSSGGKLLKPERGTNAFPAYVEGLRKWSFVLGWLDDVRRYDGGSGTEREAFDEFEAYTVQLGEFLVRRGDLPAGYGDMYARSENGLGLTSANWQRSSKSFLLNENA